MPIAQAKPIIVFNENTITRKAAFNCMEFLYFNIYAKISKLLPLNAQLLYQHKDHHPAHCYHYPVFNYCYSTHREVKNSPKAGTLDFLLIDNTLNYAYNADTHYYEGGNINYKEIIS